MIAHAIATAKILETIRVIAQTWNDQSAAVQSLQDRNDVQSEDGDPAEHEKEAQHAAEPEGGERDEARHDEPADDHEQLGDHQHETVLRVPLRFGIGFVEQERHERERPEVGQHDHHAPMRERINVGHRGHRPGEAAPRGSRLRCLGERRDRPGLCPRSLRNLRSRPVARRPDENRSAEARAV